MAKASSTFIDNSKSSSGGKSSNTLVAKQVSDKKVSNAIVAKNNSSSSDKNSSSTNYQSGGTYSDRETAFTWSDGTTTYSNATRYEDAAKEAGKNGINLVSAVTYKVSGNKNSNGNGIYSSNSPNGKSYENALNHEELLNNLYGNNSLSNKLGLYSTNGQPAVSLGAYGQGDVNNSTYNQPLIPNLDPYYGGFENNPYGPSMNLIKNQYSEFEDQIIDLNKAQVNSGTTRLESQKDTVNDYYEENARQAYINMRQQQHILPEVLSSQGITGGASETAQLSLQNQYQNNLSSINNSLASAMTDIDNAILEIRNQGDIQLAQMLLENSKNELAAYQQAMDKYISYDYQMSRDFTEDMRYANEYRDEQMWRQKEWEMEQEKMEAEEKQAQQSSALSLLNKGFIVEGASSILGIDQGQIDYYLDFINNERQLEIQDAQAELSRKQAATSKYYSDIANDNALTAARIKEMENEIQNSYDKETIKSIIKPTEEFFDKDLIENGVSIADFGRVTFNEAFELFEADELEAYFDSEDGVWKFKGGR